nr:SBBP repeat-containing protein [Candidatus Sigynarchaeota archaeon]
MLSIMVPFTTQNRLERAAGGTIPVDSSSIRFPGFTENHGQVTDSLIHYYLTTTDISVAFKPSVVEFLFKEETGARENPVLAPVHVAIHFPGSMSITPRGLGEMAHRSNFFYGNQAFTSVPSWSEIQYDGLYPGINLRYYIVDGWLKYDFIIEPGADASEIRIAVDGDVQITLGLGHQSVVIVSPGNPDCVLFEDTGLHVYQPAHPDNPVSACFVLLPGAGCEYGFEIGAYDTSEALVIDPVELAFSTFLGGGDYDSGLAIAVDTAGCAYITGNTQSSDFPTVTAYEAALNGNLDVFVTKLNATGNGLVYSTFLGGGSSETGYSIAVDATGCAYITGYSDSSGFPTMNAYDATLGGTRDVFMTKLNATGNGLVYSTFLGGGSSEIGYSIDMDASGCAYITGNMQSSDFPTMNAYDATLGGTRDVFVTKLNATGNGLVYSTFLGGGSQDYGYGIVVDIVGCAYITGETWSSDFPIASAYDSIHNGAYDVFVTKVNATGNGLVYSTFLGGSNSEAGYGIALDAAGCTCITGITQSSGFPTANAYDTTLSGSSDAFIMKINATGNGLVYSTFLGGGSIDSGYGIALDAAGCVYIAGSTASTNFPTVNSCDATYNGSNEGFVTKVNVTPSITSPPNITFVYSTIGNVISWTITDDSTGMTNYAICRNGTSIEGDSWTSGVPVEINIDGLPVGVYNYTIIASDGVDGSVQDMVIVTVLAANIAPFITNPLDITCMYGTTGHAISWTITDATTSTTSYAIYCNGTSIEGDSWTSGVPVEINIDGLPVGVYNYTIIASDGVDGSVQDTVIISVMANAPVVDGILVAIPVACFIAAITIIVFFIRRRSERFRKKVKNDGSV